jgi:hypothetical protein
VNVGDPEEAVARLADVITLTAGRRAVDPETRVHLDHLTPPPTETASGRARFRLATSDARLYPPPAARPAVAAWHLADAAKGRRLLATDIANDRRVAALLSWHFESGGRGRHSRPHLITSAATWNGATGELVGDYLVALWFLFCAAAAIDLRTVRRGEVGLVRDSAIELDDAQLRKLGLTPGRRGGGYPGDYWVFPLKLR